jgi:hypothetical protein
VASLFVSAGLQARHSERQRDEQASFARNNPRSPDDRLDDRRAA